MLNKEPGRLLKEEDKACCNRVHYEGMEAQNLNQLNQDKEAPSNFSTDTIVTLMEVIERQAAEISRVKNELEHWLDGVEKRRELIRIGTIKIDAMKRDLEKMDTFFKGQGNGKSK